MTRSPVRPRILVVAGRDSSRRAGVDADREAARRFGVEAELAVTAWTDQRGGRVLALRPVEPPEWLAAARRALPGVQAVKSGLLPGAAHVRALAQLVAGRADGALCPPVVVDPVLGASGGEVFLDEEGVEALLARLVPLGVVLTPNVPEAARLTGLPGAVLAEEPEARVEAARRLLERGVRAAVIKGGHGGEDPVQDLVLERGGGPRWHVHPRVAGASLRGSGCRYATALATGLASGLGLFEAAERAGRWLAERLAASLAFPQRPT